MTPENSVWLRFVEEAVKAFIGKFSEKTFDSVSKKIKEYKKLQESRGLNRLRDDFDLDESHMLEFYTKEFESRLAAHLNELFIWSNYIEFLPGGKPIVTEDTTGLEYQHTYIGFMRPGVQAESISEKALLDSGNHVMILGDPGSGKSTTLKRLIMNFFFTDQYENLSLGYPILVRFRKLTDENDLYSYIAIQLGIDFEHKIERYEVKEDISDHKNRPGQWSNQNRQQSEKERYRVVQRERIVFYVGQIKLQKYIGDLIEYNSVLLVLDGFDELKESMAGKIKGQISELSSRLRWARIFITSRPNYLNLTMPRWEVVFVRPLDNLQQVSIAARWLEDPQDFLMQLNEKSYKELANRPLFLSYLIFLYREGYQGHKKQLPIYSKDVYKRIINLLLTKWDESRDVKHSSTYGLYFDQEEKANFLAHLAFYLMYRLQENTFSSDSLKMAYLHIYEQFNLPRNEAELAVKELESHTGIIINSSENKFEFSHLSLQEFLCANYIILSGIENSSLRELIEINPVPFALVICLASNPENWLMTIVKAMEKLYGLEIKTRALTLLLSRLLVETPNFKKNISLGMAILIASTMAYCADDQFEITFNNLINYNHIILHSVQLCLDQYNPDGYLLSNNNQIIYRRKTSESDFFPKEIGIPASSAFVIWGNV